MMLLALAERQHVGGERHRLGVEIAAGNHLAGIGQHLMRKWMATAANVERPEGRRPLSEINLLAWSVSS
jgi:hypothetical protein